MAFYKNKQNEYRKSAVFSKPKWIQYLNKNIIIFTFIFLLSSHLSFYYFRLSHSCGSVDFILYWPGILKETSRNPMVGQWQSSSWCNGPAVHLQEKKGHQVLHQCLLPSVQLNLRVSSSIPKVGQSPSQGNWQQNRRISKTSLISLMFSEGLNNMTSLDK